MKKLPKEVKVELEALSRQLPKLQYKDFNEQQLVRGSQLLGAGVQSIKNGNKVEANGKYVTPVQPKQLDHFKKLRKIWLQANSEPEAWQKIKAYESQINHKFNQKNEG